VNCFPSSNCIGFLYQVICKAERTVIAVGFFGPSWFIRDKPGNMKCNLTFYWFCFPLFTCISLFESVCNLGQGEATHTKCKRLKLGGSQAYDHSGD
jgi:hypothetical protein